MQFKCFIGLAIMVYLTIRPVALLGYWPIAHEGEGSNCVIIMQLVGQKRQ